MGSGSWVTTGLPLQNLLAMSPEKRKLAAQEVRAAEPLLEEQSTESPYTLEEFSYQFFRCPLSPPRTARMGWRVSRGYQEGKAAAAVQGQMGRESLGTGPHDNSVSGRAPDKETISRATMPMARNRGHLWAYSPEPLRQPLLKCVHDKAKLRDPACQIFLDILPTSLP